MIGERALRQLSESQLKARLEWKKRIAEHLAGSRGTSVRCLSGGQISRAIRASEYEPSNAPSPAMVDHWLRVPELPDGGVAALQPGQVRIPGTESQLRALLRAMRALGAIDAGPTGERLERDLFGLWAEGASGMRQKGFRPFEFVTNRAIMGCRQSRPELTDEARLTPLQASS